MRIVIDGYNLIFGVPALENVLDKGNMAQARERLLLLLARHKATSNQDITVVFDGRARAEGRPAAQFASGEFEGIRVIFSRTTTADEEIKDIIGTSPNPRELCIVTSDKGILSSARAAGCHATPPETFYKKITAPFKKEKLAPAKEPMSKYKGLTTEEVEYWLEYFKGPRGKKEP